MERTPEGLARKARLRRFHGLVSNAVRSLPAEVQLMLDNVAIVVEDEPDHDRTRSEIDAHGDEVFGLYQGIPRTERTSSYSLVAPDRISLYAGPLSRAFTSRQALESEVRITLLHELGHHLGFDEDGLDMLGLS